MNHSYMCMWCRAALCVCVCVCSYQKLHQMQLALLRGYPKRIRLELHDFDDAVLKFFNVDRGELVRSPVQPAPNGPPAPPTRLVPIDASY